MKITPDVERRLWIDGFPFPSHEALRAAIAAGQAQLGIEYAAARESVRMTKSAIAEALTLALSFVMPALAVGSVVLAFATGNWWALGGVISSFLGQLLANPYNPLKWLVTLLVAGALVHVAIAHSIVKELAWVSFSFAASAIAVWTLNRLAWSWAHDAALRSEAFAAHLFSTHNLHTRDSQGEIHDAKSGE
jgi:hypothetical protein